MGHKVLTAHDAVVQTAVAYAAFRSGKELVGNSQYFFGPAKIEDNGKIRRGTLASKLTLIGDKRVDAFALFYPSGEPFSQAAARVLLDNELPSAGQPPTSQPVRAGESWGMMEEGIYPVASVGLRYQ